MASSLAPYNNAMRLGQGFNSYTQQICLNDAVMQPSRVHKDPLVAPAGDVAGKAGGTTDQQVARGSTGSERGNDNSGADDNKGRGVSQIVSYSSRFVDKLSDITDAMNISASLSIKTATIGGGASGSFVDSDKFKESDLNFYVQVKVVNQVIFGEDYTEFQNVIPAGAPFTEVYGDSFISGFEEGGELNALISVKVSDKSKTFAIKAELEATLGTPALSGEVKGGVDIEKSEVKNSTETTITVNWSGGGQIKPSDAIWDVNTLTLAAANFPDLVAKTPQRTYAILSRYTSLKSFIKIYKPSSVLTYENAGVYTSALLDMYMDYKSIWKQIQVANFELKNRRADIEVAKPSKEVTDLAASRAKARPGDEGNLTSQPKSNPRGQATLVDTKPSEDQGQTPSKDQDRDQEKQVVKLPDLVDFKPYTASVLGLDRARRDCRNEMVKIVNEVDQITTFPDLALDPHREDQFISPRVFSQLLPVVTLRAVETSDPESNVNPKNLVILGETEESPRLQQWLYNRLSSKDAPPPFPTMLQSLEKHKSRCKTFDMGDNWSGVADPGKTALFFNCLDRIDDSWHPIEIKTWVKDEILVGLLVVYASGKELPHGECSGPATGGIQIKGDEAQSAIQMVLEAAEMPGTSGARVRSMQITLDTCRSKEYPALGRPVEAHQNIRQVTLSPPTNGSWSFRGFWGAAAPFQGGFPTLGVVWGQDDAAFSARGKLASGAAGSGSGGVITSGPDYKMFVGRALPDEAIASAERYREKAGKYCMSSFIGGKIDQDKMVYFNDLERVQEDWRIKSVTFYIKDRSWISGYIINYHKGSPIRRGSCPEGALGNSGTTDPEYWRFLRLELARHEKDQSQSVLKCVRLESVGSAGARTFNSEDVDLIDRAYLDRPDQGWALCGFWGYYCESLQAFTHLGAVWSRPKELAASS